MTAYETQISSLSPVIWWKFDETSGNAVSSGSRTPTLLNLNGVTTNVTSNISNKCVTYDGTNDFHYFEGSSVQANQFNGMNDGIFTVEFWIKKAAIATTNNQVVWNLWNTGDSNRHIGMYVRGTGYSNTGKITYYTLRSGTGYQEHTSTSRVDDNNWHHIVLTQNGNTTSIYIDGTLDSTVTTWSWTTFYWDNSSTVKALLGAGVANYSTGTATEYMSGTIDEFTIYGTELSGSQITSNYYVGKGIINYQASPMTVSNSTLQNPTISINVDYAETAMTASSNMTHVPPTYGAKIASYTPIVYLPFNGTTLTEAQENYGTLNLTLSNVSGGNSLNFDGHISNTKGLKFEADNATYGYWIYSNRIIDNIYNKTITYWFKDPSSNTGNSATHFHQASLDGETRINLFRAATGHVRLAIRNDSFANVVANISGVPYDQWNMLTATFANDGTVKLYLNGELKTQTTISGTFTFSDESSYFGYIPYAGIASNSYFDEFAVFNSELTAQDVKDLFLNSGIPVSNIDIIAIPMVIQNSTFPEPVASVNSNIDYYSDPFTSTCEFPMVAFSSNVDVSNIVEPMAATIDINHPSIQTIGNINILPDTLNGVNSVLMPPIIYTNSNLSVSAMTANNATVISPTIVAIQTDTVWNSTITALNPSVWLKFDELSGNLLDNSGNGVHFFESGTTNVTRGLSSELNAGYSFPGGNSGKFITSTSFPTDTLGDYTYSIETVFKADRANVERTIAIVGDMDLRLGADGYIYVGNLNSVNPLTQQYPGYVLARRFDDGDYHQIVFTSKLEYIVGYGYTHIEKLYIDGVYYGYWEPNGYHSATNSWDQSGIPKYIGNNGAGTEQFNGIIDEFIVYSSELTPSQILNHFKIINKYYGVVVEQLIGSAVDYPDWFTLNNDVLASANGNSNIAKVGSWTTSSDAVSNKSYLTTDADNASYLRMGGYPITGLNMSFAFWMKIEGIPSKDINWLYAVYNNSDTIGSQINKNTGTIQYKLRIYGSQQPAVVSTSNVCDGSWHFITFTRAGTSLKCYVDGILEGTQTITSASGGEESDILSLSGNLLYSSNSGVNTFYDEFMAFKGVVLTQSQISALYNAGPFTSTKQNAPALTGNAIMVSPSLYLERDASYQGSVNTVSAQFVNPQIRITFGVMEASASFINPFIIINASVSANAMSANISMVQPTISTNKNLFISQTAWTANAEIVQPLVGLVINPEPMVANPAKITRDHTVNGARIVIWSDRWYILNRRIGTDRIETSYTPNNPPSVSLGTASNGIYVALPVESEVDNFLGTETPGAIVESPGDRYHKVYSETMLSKLGYLQSTAPLYIGNISEYDPYDLSNVSNISGIGTENSTKFFSHEYIIKTDNENCILSSGVMYDQDKDMKFYTKLYIENGYPTIEYRTEELISGLSTSYKHTGTQIVSDDNWHHILFQTHDGTGNYRYDYRTNSIYENAEFVNEYYNDGITTEVIPSAEIYVDGYISIREKLKIDIENNFMATPLYFGKEIIGWSSPQDPISGGFYQYLVEGNESLRFTGSISGIAVRNVTTKEIVIDENLSNDVYTYYKVQDITNPLIVDAEGNYLIHAAVSPNMARILAEYALSTYPAKPTVITATATMVNPLVTTNYGGNILRLYWNADNVDGNKYGVNTNISNVSTYSILNNISTDSALLYNTDNAHSGGSSDPLQSSMEIIEDAWRKFDGKRRFINIQSDIPNYSEIDTIIFIDSVNESSEYDKLMPNYTRQYVISEYDEFIKSLKQAVVDGKNLFIADHMLAVDLGIVNGVTEIDQLTESVVPISDPFNDDLNNIHYDNVRLNKYRIFKTEDGLTDIPSYIMKDVISHTGNQSDDYHIKYENRPNGLTVTDTFMIPSLPIMKIQETRDVVGDLTNRVGFAPLRVFTENQIISGRAIAKIDGTDYITTIIVKPGDMLNGQIVKGKIFVNCVENAIAMGLKEYNYANIQIMPENANGENLETKQWQYSTSRTTHKLESDTNIVSDIAQNGQTYPSNGGGGGVVQSATHSSTADIRVKYDMDNDVFTSGIYYDVNSEIYPLETIPVLSMTYRGLSWLLSGSGYDGIVVPFINAKVAAAMPAPTISAVIIDPLPVKSTDISVFKMTATAQLPVNFEAVYGNLNSIILTLHQPDVITLYIQGEQL